MQLISYVKTITNKQLLIRIDVHPVGKNPTNTPHSFHAQSAYASRPYVSHKVRIWKPFVSRQQGWMDTLLLRKSALDSTS
jgi:hypothetical protein